MYMGLRPSTQASGNWVVHSFCGQPTLDVFLMIAWNKFTEDNGNFGGSEMDHQNDF